MDEALTVKEVAAKLRVHPMTVYRLISAGRLKAFRTGTRRREGGYRIWQEDLKAFTEANQDARS